ncbi:MAG: hypothetical protein CM15mP103_04500 [Gammaproteobacteria bacterium]|nr:MAG: hypothetical protein CM15mP103_04500 [Gammaproteobacteria bacterium]
MKSPSSTALTANQFVGADIGQERGVRINPDHRCIVLTSVRAALSRLPPPPMTMAKSTMAPIWSRDSFSAFQSGTGSPKRPSIVTCSPRSSSRLRSPDTISSTPGCSGAEQAHMIKAWSSPGA